MAQVRLEHLYKAFDKTEILHDLSLTVEDREFLVLVGPSGCGKSTVLRMIAGLENPTQGTIQIGGRVVNDVAPKDRDIAMVFQSYALYPHMSVYDNMAFGLKMRKTPKPQIQERVEEAARILDLAPLLKRKPKQLSGGQRQRVALGRAIVRHPQVFLMDEPLSNLDAKLRVQMRAEIQKLHRNLGATTIYVTHDQTEAMTMGDRIVVLNGGVVQQVGDPATLYTQPANVFVGAFIGTMMFLTLPYQKGQLTLSSGETWTIPLKNFEGQSVQVGIRPEHFQHQSTGGQPITVIPDLVELLGAEKLVHFTFEGQPIVSSLPADVSVTEGTPLSLFLQLEKLSYFDPATGNNLL